MLGQLMPVHPRDRRLRRVLLSRRRRQLDPADLPCGLSIPDRHRGAQRPDRHGAHYYEQGLASDGGPTLAAGETFSKSTQLTAAAGNARQIGRQGCTIRTESRGTVYLFFEGAVNKQPVQEMTRSFDGGKSFDKPRAVASVTDVGGFDPVQQDIVFDGVTGARTDSFPSVEIANGAQYGTDATNVIALAWADARAGLNHEQALVQLFSDQGQTWTTPADGAQSG